MNNKFEKSKNHGACLALGIFMMFAMMLSVDTIQAQTTVVITGKVTDASTGDFLPGASIMLQGTTFGTVSDRAGNYGISNVPAGSYVLLVNYIGYQEYSSNIQVSVDVNTVEHDVGLNLSVLKLTEVVVTGLREGQMKALSQQKNAMNIKNIIAAEQMQRFPDLNTAEVMQRIPAVSIERDQGEGRYVLIRGTEARLNAVTINGVGIASPETEERFVGLDVISASQLASIEVIKAITPDMDADAIGGSVNLVTMSAFDSDSRVFSISGGSGYGDLMGEPMYQGDIVFAERFGVNKNIGIALSANFSQSNRGSDNNEMEWGSEKDVNGNEIPWALQDLQLRDYIVKRDRWGFSGNLDYRPDDDHQLFLRVMYNQRDDLEQRRRLRIRPDKGDYQDATHITEAAIERQLKDRLETQDIFSISGGGLHQLDKFEVDYTLAYSRAEEKKPNQLNSTFELNQDADLTLNLSNPNTPQYNITNLVAGYEHNPDNFIFDEIEYEDKSSKDDNLMAALNFKYPYLLGGNSGELKFGAKVYLKTKQRNNTSWEYGWEGDDDQLMSQFLATDEDLNFLDGDYRFGPSPDPDKMRRFFNDNRDGLLQGEINREDSDAENYKASENIIAYYGMTTHNFGKLRVLAGFRHEITSIDNTGNEVLFNEDGDYESTQEVKTDDSYSHLLPSLHLRYSLTPNTNIRSAFTSGIARPNYYDLVPYKIILTEDDEMVIGNPELKPTTANSFDLLGEHYLPGIGILSGGLFYKAMDNIIYTSIDQQAGGRFDGFEVEQKVNGKTASLYGFEVNWQQQFTFLPGFWNGFGIHANYTHTKSEADLADRESISLPGQAGDVANFAISYEKYGFTGLIGLNYHGSYISEVGKDAEHDIYYDDRLQLDLSASMWVSRGMQVYLKAINLTNEPLRYYIGQDDRPVQREFYSWWMLFGLKYIF